MRDSKMIKITSRGFVTTSRGRVMTPILCPYRESISRIWTMMTVDRADIEEKLPDGTFIKLTAQNFDKDNFVSKEIKKQNVEPKVQDKSEAETFKNTDNKKEEQVEKPVEVTKVEQPKEPEEVKPVVEDTNEVTDEVKEENSEHTITVNGEKRVDPRFNKKNKNKNRNNNNNQSLAVDAEVVE